MSSEMVLALPHTCPQMVRLASQSTSGASSPRRRDLCSNGNNTSHSRVQDDVAATLKEIRAMVGSSSGAITNSVVRSSMSTSSREADTAARNRESCKPYTYDSSQQAFVGNAAASATHGGCSCRRPYDSRHAAGPDHVPGGLPGELY